MPSFLSDDTVSDCCETFSLCPYHMFGRLLDGPIGVDRRQKRVLNDIAIYSFFFCLPGHIISASQL